MNKTLLLIIFLLGGGVLNIAAQTCKQDYLGTKTLYPVPDAHTSKAPKGYQPVFINYVGRHGARHLTKDVDQSFAFKFFSKADSLHSLTKDGQRLWQMMVKLNRVEHGKVKSISAEGRQELKGLGERMYQNYPEVFEKPVRLNVALTKEIRTKQSADAFLNGLKASVKDSISINQYNDDLNLRFYDLSPAYTSFEDKGRWKDSLNLLRHEEHLNELLQHVIVRWFKPSVADRLKAAEKDKLVADVFGFASIVPSVAEEIEQARYMPDEVNISSVFTCAELAALGKIDAADDYYKKGPGLDNNGIQVRIAAPLLIEFIKSTEEFMHLHSYNCQLRFAHAETIAPFAALLELEPASSVAATPATIEKSWKAGEVIPLSANIEWILYRNRRNDYLIKFLLNEREVKIKGLQPGHGYYYKWKNVQHFYKNKLLTLRVAENDNMEQYLSNIK